MFLATKKWVSKLVSETIDALIDVVRKSCMDLRADVASAKKELEKDTCQFADEQNKRFTDHLKSIIEIRNAQQQFDIRLGRLIDHVNRQLGVAGGPGNQIVDRLAEAEMRLDYLDYRTHMLAAAAGGSFRAKEDPAALGPHVLLVKKNGKSTLFQVKPAPKEPTCIR